MTVADLIDNPEFKSMMLKAYDKAFADGVQHERERCAKIAERCAKIAEGVTIRLKEFREDTTVSVMAAAQNVVSNLIAAKIRSGAARSPAARGEFAVYEYCDVKFME